MTSVRSSKHRPSSDGALAWLSMHISLRATPFLSPTGFSLSVLMASFHLGSFWWPLFSPTRGESSSNIADWLQSTRCLCCWQKRSVQSGNCVTFNEWGLPRFRSCFALWIKGEWKRQMINMQKEHPAHQAYLCTHPLWMYHIYLPWDTNQAHLQHAAVAFLLFLHLLLLLQASVKALGSPGLLRQPPSPIRTFLCPSLTWITHDQTVCVELISQLLPGPHRHWWLHKAASPHWRLAPPPDVHGGEWWIIGHHSLPSSAGAVKAIPRGLVRHGWSSNTCNVARRGSGGTWTPPQSVTWTFRRCYVCRFSWYIYACVNTHTPGWILDRGESCVSLQFPVLTGTFPGALLLGSHTHSGLKQRSQPGLLVYSYGERGRKRRRRETLTRK